MIKFIKNNRRLWLVFVMLYLFIILVLTMPSGYSIITPGGLTNISQNIVIGDEYPDNTSFYSIHVSTYQKMTFFQYLVTNKNKHYDVYQPSAYQNDISLIDNYHMGQVSKKASYQYSIIYAYQAAIQENPSINIEYSFLGLRIYYRPSKLKNLLIDDLVVGVKSESEEIIAFKEMSISQITDMMNLAKKNNVTLLIKRNNQILEETVNLLSGDYLLSYYPDYDINTTPRFEQPGLSSNVGGPSGGLLQALSLYSTLTNKNYGNIIIAGTGTLDYDGSIGKIGGARQKIYTAINNNVDYFFITASNYQAPGNDLTDYVSDMSELALFLGFYVIETFSEAIQYLNYLAL